MPIEVSLTLTPKQSASREQVHAAAIEKSGIRGDRVERVLTIHQSIDARGKNVRVNLRVRVYERGETAQTDTPRFNYQNVAGKPEVIIVGAGPAGLFAALKLIELGLKPIILERGKDVGSRKRDVATLNRNGAINPNSNYAFGEGGAGTFSDGKLYTRSHKRGSNDYVIHTLHQHGAPDEILYQAHPHIGTNILPRVITAIRQTIEGCGGHVAFSSTANGLVIRSSRAMGVTLTNGQQIEGVGVILAPGHSASDTYRWLHQQGVALQSKPFAMGVRVEHPQLLIDRIQYHCSERDAYLPAASYSLVHQVEGRGVYSFCMCPGGYIVPAASGPGEVVVNGMSPSGRNSKWANSGVVVEIQPPDFHHRADDGPLAGLAFQQELERLAYQQVQNGVMAPAQGLADFLCGRESTSLPPCSYHPGVVPSRLDQWLPPLISSRLMGGFRAFDRRMRGFVAQEAVILGVESRTSSPVRIPRDPKTLEHIGIKGLYPCGEGAGYAGGIVSSAVDGLRVADAVGRAVSLD